MYARNRIGLPERPDYPNNIPVDPLIRHHIYPIRDVMRISCDYITGNIDDEDFDNPLPNNHLAKVYLNTIATVLDNVIEENNGANMNNIGLDGVVTWQNFVNHINDDLIGNNNFEEFDALLRMLGWQQWNLVLGPNNRPNDPRENFDQVAFAIRHADQPIREVLTADWLIQHAGEQIFEDHHVVIGINNNDKCLIEKNQ